MAEHRKRLIVCLDGTWNTPDQKGGPTNVVKLMRAVQHVDNEGVPQIAFYDKGVGTGGLTDRIRGGASGRGLDENVRDGYRFLAHNFQKDDEIYLFGFSRGAFTARSLAGFIGACGLLDKPELELLPQAWDYYRTPPDERDVEGDSGFKAKSRMDVNIKCVGVWDTVGALGVPVESFNWFNKPKYQFHDTTIGGNIDNAFHAIAIDEKRGPFAPALWEGSEQTVVNRTIEQVWFPGVHSNIGGGYDDHKLSDVTLQWMLRRVRDNTDLALDEAAFKDDKDIHSWAAAGKLYESRSAVYTASKTVPYQRLINQFEVPRGWIRRLFPRTNRPAAGNHFINERIHVSAFTRYGNPCPTEESGESYEPPNLKSALENDVGAVGYQGENIDAREARKQAKTGPGTSGETSADMTPAETVPENTGA